MRLPDKIYRLKKKASPIIGSDKKKSISCVLGVTPVSENANTSDLIIDNLKRDRVLNTSHAERNKDIKHQDKLYKSENDIIQIIDDDGPSMMHRLIDPSFWKTNQHTAPTEVPTIITTSPTPPPPSSSSSTTTNTTTSITAYSTSITSSTSTFSTTAASQKTSPHADRESSGLILSYPNIRIFLVVFRKFMTPSQLVQALIAEFTSGSTNQDDDQFEPWSTTTLLLNDRQKSICHLFDIWLTHYWGDFKSSATRQALLEFLAKTSAYEEIVAIHNKLLSLILNESDPKDRDACWGMVDEGETTDIPCDKCTSAPPPLPSPPVHKPKDNDAKSKVERASAKPSIKVARPVFESLLLRKNQQQQQKNKESRSSFGGTDHYVQSIDTLDSEAQYNKLLSFKPTKIAEQLTCIDQKIFNRIQPRDFLCQLWSNHKKIKSHCVGCCDNAVSASIEHFNFVSGWIAFLIVNQPLIKKRVAVFEFCLKVAMELKRMNNFNTLMAVIAGVNSAAVLRLKQTRSAVEHKHKKLFNQFRELETLMNYDRSFRLYRNELKRTTDAGIPYLGIHIQDLVSLGEANKDFNDNDGKVHWTKFELIGKSIFQVIEFQNPTYPTITPDPDIICFIGDKSTILTEDERYEKSIKIEPKPSPKPSKSTSSALSFLMPKHDI